MGRPVKTIMKGLNDHEIKFANGAYGGFGPQSNMFITFFAEHYAIPEIENGELSKEGKPIMPKPSDDSELVVEREVVARIALDLDTTKRIHKWLGEHIKQVESKKKEVEKDGSAGECNKVN